MVSKHLWQRGTRSLLVFSILLFATTLITYRGANLPITRHRLFRSYDASHLTAQEFRLDGDRGFRIGEKELKRAIQYEGTGERIKRFLAKARSGKGFTVSVVGGSVSKGRGLRPVDAPMRNLTGAATLYSQENMHLQIYEWLDARYPSVNNRFINGAQGGVGAGYFAWCFGEHIPEDTDLILVELGINDVFSPSLSPKYEHLIRTLLTMPNKPAIINIEVFSLLFDTVMTSSSLHGDILAFYDVPSLSVRDLLMPSLTARPEVEIPRWFRTDRSLTLKDTKVREWAGQMVDLLHFSALGHRLSAQVVNKYLENMVRQAHTPWWSFVRHSWLKHDVDVPSNLLTSPFDPHHPPILSRPTCRSVNANLDTDLDSITGVGRLAPFRGSSGWSEWQWKEKKYLVSSTPGSSVHFHFIIAPEDAQGLPDTDVRVLAQLQKEEEAMLQHVKVQSKAGEQVVTPESAQAEQLEKVEKMEEEAILAVSPGTAEGGDEAVAQSEDGQVGAEDVGRRFLGKRQVSTRSPGRPGRNRGGWRGRKGPGKGLTRPPIVSQNHAVGLAFMRSKTFGLGKVKCWVDEREDEAVVLDGYWEEPIRNSVVAETIATNLESGPHSLNCEHLPNEDGSATEFRIVAVMYD